MNPIYTPIAEMLYLYTLPESEREERILRSLQISKTARHVHYSL